LMNTMRRPWTHLHISWLWVCASCSHTYHNLTGNSGQRST
jgi:hypothetical protein